MPYKPNQKGTNSKPLIALKLLCLGILLLSTALILMNSLTAASFTAIATVWFLIYAVASVDPETITEVRLWAGSIKRDVEAAENIRREIEETKEGIRQAAHALTEMSYYMLKFGYVTENSRFHPLANRLDRNFSIVTTFVEPDEQKRLEWLERLGVDVEKE